MSLISALEGQGPSKSSLSLGVCQFSAEAFCPLLTAGGGEGAFIANARARGSRSAKPPSPAGQRPGSPRPPETRIRGSVPEYHRERSPSTAGFNTSPPKTLRGLPYRHIHPIKKTLLETYVLSTSASKSPAWSARFIFSTSHPLGSFSPPHTPLRRRRGYPHDNSFGLRQPPNKNFSSETRKCVS